MFGDVSRRALVLDCCLLFVASSRVTSTKIADVCVSATVKTTMISLNVQQKLLEENYKTPQFITPNWKKKIEQAELVFKILIDQKNHFLLRCCFVVSHRLHSPALSFTHSLIHPFTNLYRPTDTYHISSINETWSPICKLITPPCTCTEYHINNDDDTNDHTEKETDTRRLRPHHQ